MTTVLTMTVRATGAYDLSNDTFLLLMVEPTLSGPTHSLVQQNLLTTPTPFSELWTDAYGNLQRRLVAPAGPFTFDYQVTAKVEANEAVPDDAEVHKPRDLPAETLLYTLPSRYCQSDRLTRMAQDLFGQSAPGGARVNAVAEWVRKNVEYRYGTTNAMTSAVDTVVERVGVCRDFAHLTISFCRALGIPARYVSGYALGLKPCDFHAYVQVYLGNRWRNIDATYDGVRPALLPIGVGRDAADLAMLTLFGTGELREQSVLVREAE